MIRLIAATEIKVWKLTTLIREFVMNSEKYGVYEMNQKKKIRFDWKQGEMINEEEGGFKKEAIEIKEIKETLFHK